MNSDYFNLECEGHVYNLVFNGIKANLDKTFEWNQFDKESKIEHIENLALPYLLNEEQINSLYYYKEQ